MMLLHYCLGMAQVNVPDNMDNVNKYVELAKIIVDNDFNAVYEYICQDDVLFGNKYMWQYLDQWQHKIED